MIKIPLSTSIVGRAQKNHKIVISLVNPRDYATDKHKSVDDRPYGGGAGMLLRVDVVEKAITVAKKLHPSSTTKVILLDAGGKLYTQKEARNLTHFDHIIFVCGHYEGVDDRVRLLVDEEMSIGDFIVTGGELPAMIIADSVIRLLPGVLTKEEATRSESFGDSPQLEYPQFTKPRTFAGISVPEVLTGGNHKAIESWKKEASLKRTIKVRPDLLPKKI